MPEFSSPACSMHEASDAYMGYPGKNEVISFLNDDKYWPRRRDIVSNNYSTGALTLLWAKSLNDKIGPASECLQSISFAIAKAYA